MFNRLLDISGFFLIIVINLSLIALLCYYAKKKFESIEDIQKEQSNILFNLVNKDNNDIDPMFLTPSIDANQELPQVNDSKIVTLNESIVLNEKSSEDSSDDEDESSDDEDESSDDEDESSVQDIDEVKDNTGEDDDDEDDEDQDEDEDEDEDEDGEKKENLDKTDNLNEENSELNLEKMTRPQLKEYIESKGQKINIKKLKKNEILDYIKENNL
tara:strand:- start:1351 stop:1995 length:645 start_codon:yes stop_codon:yes gene_type:complete